MKQNRLTALWLSILMLFGTLTGCGNTAADIAAEIAKQAAVESGLVSIEPDSPADNAVPEDTETPDSPSDEAPDEPLPAEEMGDAITGTIVLSRSLVLDEEGAYDGRDEVALYLMQYGRLPLNYITKKEAQSLGWSGGSLEPYAPGRSIGGDRFGNYEGALPEAEGRRYTECDIDTGGAKSRGAKRLVFSNDGLIFYTEDHYQTFTYIAEG